jgi:putative hydrolase of the HAD superfamily
VKVRGVLLDLDGTLVDHAGAVRDALAGWLPVLGVPVTEDVIAQWLAAQERHLTAWRERRVTFAEQRRRRLRDFLPAVGLPVDDDPARLDEVFKGFLHRYEASWRAFADVGPALADLRRAGLPTAVLTNGTTGQQTAKLAKVGLLGRVGPVYTAEALGAAKPFPAAFLAACAQWGHSPATVVNVGDRYDLDVLAARAAGLRAVHLDRSGEGPTDEPMRIGSLRDLPALIG